MAVSWSCMFNSHKVFQNRSVLNRLPPLPCISTLNVKPQLEDGEFSFTSFISNVLDFIFTIGSIAGMIHLHEVLYKGFNLHFCVTEMQRFTEELLLVNQDLRTTCNCALQVTIITHILKNSPIHARNSLKFVPKKRY